MEIQAITASILITLLSFSGVFLFGKKGRLIGTTRFVIPVAIGMFLGIVFFGLIPETLEGGGEFGSVAIVVGFLSFYLLSYLLHTYHHHHKCGEHDGCENKSGASMLLIGDAVHNLADGIVIASAFLINPAVGIATTIGVALHEIPQEIAEFGVLMKAGYTTKKAVFYNFLSATSVIIGTILTLIFAESLGSYIWVLTGIASGNLLYIVASDLIPSLHEETHTERKFMGMFVATIIGLVFIALLLEWTHRMF